LGVSVRTKKRIPRAIRQTGDKYQVSAARMGLFTCPHLGLLCGYGSARDIANCPGNGHCELRKINSLVDRLWDSRLTYETTKTNLDNQRLFLGEANGKTIPA